MVSEGVDIPRAAVLGLLTSYRTPLFFAQAVGRVVRARGPQETATVFLPAVRPLLRAGRGAGGAAQPRRADRRTGRATTWTPSSRSRTGSTSRRGRGSSRRWRRRPPSPTCCTPGGRSPPRSGSPDGEHDDYLGLPGLLTPEQTAALLASRDVELRRRTSGLFEEDGRRARRPVVLAGGRGAAQGHQPAGRPGRGPDRAQARRRARRRTQEVPGPRTASASVEVLLARRDYLLGQVR